MTPTVAPSTIPCPHCSAPPAPDGVVYGHAFSDPLQVAECATCRRVLDVGGHDW